MNWLTTNVRMPPTTAMPLEQHQRHRAAAGRAAPVQQVDDRQQQRGQHRRQRDRHDDDFELRDHPQHRDDAPRRSPATATPRRAVLRTNGVTDSSAIVG